MSWEPYPIQARERDRPALLAGGALLVGALLGVGIAFSNPLVALLGLLALAGAWIVMRWPEAGLLAFVAVANLLPFAVVPVYIGFSLTLVDLVLLLLLLSWLFWAVYRGRPVVGSGLNPLILLYLGLALTSFTLGLTYSITPERFRLFLKSINSILLFFSVINCVRDLAGLKRAILAVLISSAGAAAIALAFLFLPTETALRLLGLLAPLGYPTGPEALRPIADTEILRAIGTAVDPNVLGGMLMLAAGLFVGQLFSARPLLPRTALLLLLPVVLAALLLTYSRSALGGAVIGATLVGVLRDRRLLVLVLLAVVVFPFLPRDWVFVERIWSGLAFEDRGAAMRLNEYEDAINLITMYPWFGIGFGEPPSIDQYLGVSSMYLLVGQEMGLIGMASFLAILGALAWQLVAGLRSARDEEVRGILAGLAAALVAASAAGLLDHYFVNIVFPHMVALFWLYAGLAVVASRLARDQ